MDQIFTQGGITHHLFTLYDNGYPKFSDAIVIPTSEYNLLTPEQIETIKQTRLDNWVWMITHPVEEGQ